MPDGSLRVFFGGIRSTNPGETNNAMNTATAPASGAPWTLQPGKAAQATYAYATSYAGAGLAKDGTPISTWAGTPGLGFHYGVDPSAPDGKIPQSELLPRTTPTSRVDSASGQAWVGFHSNENASARPLRERDRPGRAAGRSQAGAADPRQGKDFLQPSNRTSLTGRIGAAGVFLVFGQGYPTFKTIAVWRVGTGEAAARHQGERNEARERRGRARGAAVAHVGAQRHDLRDPDEPGGDPRRAALDARSAGQQVGLPL